MVFCESLRALAIRPSAVVVPHYSVCGKKLPSATSSKRHKSRRMHTRALLDDDQTWWEAKGGLNFACTGCGGCCKVRGEVWASPKEVDALAAHVGVPRHEFVTQYGDTHVRGWLRLRDKVIPSSDSACIFLNEDNTCSVYNVRPVQCSTYPFWPRLIESQQAWVEEAVEAYAAPQVSQASAHGHANAAGQPPVDHRIKGRFWSPENGGCEGIKVDARLDQVAEATPVEARQSSAGVAVGMRRASTLPREAGQGGAGRYMGASRQVGAGRPASGQQQQSQKKDEDEDFIDAGEIHVRMGRFEAYMRRFPWDELPPHDDR